MNNSFFELDIHRLDDSGDALIIIDQTELPTRQLYIELKTKEEVYSAIKQLKVRGAPAIGIAAAFGLYLSIKHSVSQTYDDFYQEFMQNKNFLSAARPTAVNLNWALNRMEFVVIENKEKPIKQIMLKLKEEAERIKEEDIMSTVQESNFNKFWAVYPRKESKAKAVIVWQRINPNDMLFTEIMKGLERYLKCRKVADGFIQLATTWLNGKEWESVYEEPTKSTRQKTKHEIEAEEMGIHLI